MSGFTIEKRGYSVGPWRIIFPDGGTELAFPRDVDLVDHFTGRTVTHRLLSAGFATKALAVEALGEYCYTLHAQQGMQRLTATATA